jgi:hypothetical protein
LLIEIVRLLHPGDTLPLGTVVRMYINNLRFGWNGVLTIWEGCRFGIRQDHSIEFGCCDLAFAWFCVVGEVVPKVIYFRSLLGRQRFVLSLPKPTGLPPRNTRGQGKG